LINNFKNNEIISTITGRFYAMDRIKKWKRTEMAYNSLVLGQGIVSDNPYRAISEAYNREETDEFIAPIVIMNPIKKPKFIDNNDAVIFFNLRSDRARQLTKTFVQKNFEKDNKNSFKRKKILKNLKFVTMADFGPDLDDIKTISRSYILENTLPLALRNFRQLYLAEREKYAHMTYFFNGGHNTPVNGEKWQVISSLGQKNYEKFPQMSSRQLCKIICTNLKKDSYDFIAVNFANADMLAHTGNLKSTIKSIEIADECLGCLYKHVAEHNGTLLITADHGNAEELKNLETGEIDTEHSANPVPLILVNKKFNKKNMKLRIGKLADIAPTILHILNIKKPKEMTGRSLILKYDIRNKR
ncbi:phosphoglycerate mutase (2,3-diphosphoglycerate-independent), partial [Candidatus Falkowbacteria bacterium]|nr:phosphoglycerate mutase (2,3-diphosphoglycerate-independent) [Candidatus Falkowbacteria bacterium]